MAKKLRDAIGKLIVIEGGDAAGKATQIALLTGHLLAEERKVTQFDFPQYQTNHVGGLLRECLDGERGDFMSIDPRIAAVLYGVDRLESLKRIQSWLADGTTVILDRYTSANMVHQGAKITDAKERLETMQWIYKLEHKIFGLPLPDAIFTLPVAAALRAELRQRQARIKGRMIDLADQDQVHQQHVDDTLLELSTIYDHVIPVETMHAGKLRLPEDISTDIIKDVRAILDKT